MLEENQKKIFYMDKPAGTYNKTGANSRDPKPDYTGHLKNRTSMVFRSRELVLKQNGLDFKA
jgi:hypothetical protein